VTSRTTPNSPLNSPPSTSGPNAMHNTRGCPSDRRAWNSTSIIRCSSSPRSTSLTTRSRSSSAAVLAHSHGAPRSCPEISRHAALPKMRPPSDPMSIAGNSTPSRNRTHGPGTTGSALTKHPLAPSGLFIPLRNQYQPADLGRRAGIRTDRIAVRAL